MTLRLHFLAALSGCFYTFEFSEMKLGLRGFFLLLCLVFFLFFFFYFLFFPSDSSLPGWSWRNT